jgi:hypothetical protein
MHNQWESGQGHLEWYVAWDEITMPPCILVLRAEVSPSADTVTFIPDYTDNILTKEFPLSMLVKRSIHFIYICDNNLIFQIFNVLIHE